MLAAKKTGSWDNVLLIPRDGGAPYRPATSVRYQYLVSTVKGDHCNLVVGFAKESWFESLYEELSDRELNISYAEVDLKNKNESLEGERQFISEEKIRLADQRATLQRAFARIKK